MPTTVNFEPYFKLPPARVEWIRDDSSPSVESAHSTRSLSPTLSEPWRGPCLLLSLPAEIRTVIWKSYFRLSDQPVTISLSPSRANSTSSLRLLLVSQSVYAEASSLFYSLNTLSLSSPSALYHFLSTLAPSRRSHIRSLHVANFGLHYIGWSLAKQAFSLLHLCHGLKELRIDFGTDISWNVLEPALRERQGASILSEGLDVLASIRGIERASIRAISPALWRHNQLFSKDLLVEVDTQYAQRLKERWMQKKTRVRASRPEVLRARSTAGAELPDHEPWVEGRVLKKVLKRECVRCQSWESQSDCCLDCGGRKFESRMRYDDA